MTKSPEQHRRTRWHLRPTRMPEKSDWERHPSVDRSVGSDSTNKQVRRRPTPKSLAAVLLLLGAVAANAVGASPVAASEGAYVANTGPPNNVSQYAVGAGGLLSLVGPSVDGGNVPVDIAVTLDGKNAYVSNLNDTVAQFSIDPLSDLLSPKTPTTVATGSLPYFIAVSPNSKNAYVTNDGDHDVSQYSIDPVTGALSPLTPATVGAGKEPQDIAGDSD